MIIENYRLTSIKIINSILENQSQLTKLFIKHNASSKTKKICFEICRFFFTLDRLLAQYLKKKPPIKIYAILLVGAYEILYLKNKQYASINELVKLTADSHKGFVNAILRKLTTTKTQNAEWDYHNHPTWLYNRINNDWPKHAEDIFKANNQHPPLTIRINQNLFPNFKDLLKTNNIKYIDCIIAKDGVILDPNTEIKDLPDFEKGSCIIQDEAGQLVTECLMLEPDLKILDCCAAPGGKASHILLQEPSTNLTMIEKEPNRIKQLIENLTRLNLLNNASNNITCGDAANPEQWYDGCPFDRILLDAPCSATGVIRRHPDIKILRKPSEIKDLLKIQRQLLNKLWPLLKNNGYLIYTTCSILSAENDLQILDFVKNNNAKIISSNNILDKYAIKTKTGWQFLPGNIYNTDGFFYCILQRDD